MQAELINVRAQLMSALATIDSLLAGAPGAEVTVKYRVSPGGPLSEAGIAEMYRRFEANEPDAVIARAMAVSVQGCQKRRAIWKKERARG
jgi:hypothetical protein